MTSTTPLLSVRNLGTQFTTIEGEVATALENVSFDVHPGQTVGLVGESGCGKTTTLLSVMRLLPVTARITTGQVIYNGTDLLTLSEAEMRHFRWKEMSIVFQGAMNALNPVMPVGEQISEAIILHNLMDRTDANMQVDKLLDLVGIATSRKNQYPHQYSGGMRQRAMIAMALACQPSLLFADEPTTALDVMIQAQILDLLQNLQKELGLAIVLVTHDLGVVAEVCDSVVVMYGGKVAEYGPAEPVYNEPQHPYTQRLLEAFPDLNRPAGELATIPGTPPRLNALPSGCRFAPRCHERMEMCDRVAPDIVNVSTTQSYPPSAKGRHVAACHLLEGAKANF